jgi:hypothetical protein
VLERWRGATTNQRANMEDGATVDAEAAPLQPANTPDANRFRILKKSFGDPAQPDQPAGSPGHWPAK